MKKRLKNSIISIALALMMVVTYTPLAGITGIENSTAEAATNVCQIGSTNYTSISDAVSAAKSGDTIKLTAGISNQRLVLSGGKKLTVDLNGKTWSYAYKDDNFNRASSSTDEYGVKVSGSGTELTIKDSGSNSSSQQVNMVMLVDGSTLNITGGKIRTNIVLKNSSSVLNQTGGELWQTNGEPTVDMRNGGTYNYSGGTISSGRCSAVYNYASNAKINISGTAVINTGSFSQNSNKNITASGGIFSSSYKTIAEKSWNIVTGAAFQSYNYSGSSSYYKLDPPVASIGSTYYTSLASALSAASNGATINLIADTTETGNAIFGNAVTINGNGHTITINRSGWWMYITNSSGNVVKFNNCVFRGPNASGGTGIIAYVAGSGRGDDGKGNHKLAFEGCTFKEFPRGPLFYNFATVEVNRCKFDGVSYIYSNYDGGEYIELADASIGNTKYDNFSDAVKAVKSGDTIKLLRNISNNKLEVSGGKKITLDLNGKTWSYPYTEETSGRPTSTKDEYGIKVSGSGTELTIKDSGSNSSSQQVSMVMLVDGATLNVAGGKLTTSIVLKNASSVLNQSGGEIHQTNGEPTIYMNSGGTYNYSGGNIYSGRCYAIRNSSSAKINVSGEAVIDQGAFAEYAGKNITAAGGYFKEYYKNEAAEKWTIDEECSFKSVSGKPAAYQLAAAERAAIGDTKYPTLKKALAAAKSGDTIKILEDMSGVAFTVPSGKKLTLDLNGHKLSGTNKDAFNFNSYCNSTSNKCTLEVKDSTAELTVTDSSSTKAGTVDGTVGIKNGKFTLKEGKITGGVYMTGDSAVLNVNGGEISDKWETLCWNSGTVNINGGKVVGGTAAGVIVYMCNSDKAKLNISGLATIEGSSFSAMSTPFNKGNVQITGGYYKNDSIKNYLTEDYWLVNSTTNTGYYEVKGAERVAIGNARYSTLTKALNSAKSGDTITLLEDVEKNTFVVPLDMKLTLDLNGHKLSQVIKGEANDTDKDAQSKAVIDSKYLNSELTVKDSSSAKTGSISGFVKVSDGTINWESGDLTSGGVVLSGEDAVFNMKGGTFTPAPVTQTIALKYGTFNGTGGTIKAGNGYAIDLYSKENAVLKLSGSITISGAPVCGAIKAFKNGKVDISGGFYMTTWTDAINQLLTDDYSLIESTAKSGYSEVKAFERVAIGATTYPSLTKALAAANNGDTIKILMDAETKATVSKEVTIDLQDCTLTAKDSSGAITVAQGGSLTLGTTGAGKVNKGSSKYAIKNAGGKLVITSGVFQGVANAAAGAATEITGGHFTSGLANTDGAKFAISGGWFPTAVPDSYVAEGLYPTNKFPELGGEGTEYTVGHRVTLDLNYQGSDGLWHFVGPVTGFRMNKPNTPIREDYIFLSWYTDKECTKEFSFDTVIQDNTVLYAKWKMEDPWKDNCPGNCKHEVAVGTRHYKTLKDAINNAASGSEIVLLKDIAAGVTVPSGKSFTIDLKGHIIGPETSEKPIIENKGTLVIKDSSAGSKGKISISKMNGEQVAVENYEGTLTLVSGTINNANERISTISNKGGTLNINGGTVNSELGYAIYNGGSQTRAGTVNMTGGEVTAATYQAIWTLSSGYVTVSGGKVYSGRYYAIEAGGYDADNNPWNGYVTINGGQVISRASEANMAAILNFAGTVNINSNEKNDKYPQIVGKIPLISNSKFNHSNNISGGWFSSKLGTDDPSTKYMRNGVVLYPTDAIKSGPSGAQYTIGYRIAFDENHGDGRMHYSYTLPEDGTVAKPANPIRLGYIFSGWFRDPAGVTAFNFEDEKASGSMTLYAVWAEGAQLSITGQKMVVGNYILTIKAVSQGGTIVAAPLSGTQVKITLTPAAGYKPGSFFMDGDYVNDGYSSYKLTISGDTTISATFKPATMSAEEYRASVEQDKLRQEEGTLEFGTVTDAERERTTTTPAETKDKGGPRTSGDEDYDETGNGSGKPATGEDGEPYDPGEQYEKEIRSGGGSQGGGQGSGQSGTDKEQNWFFVEEEFYEEETGTDSKGWTYVGEDVEKYIPSESELEHLERIDPTLPVKDQIAQAKEILAKFNLKTKSGLAVSPKGKGAVKIVWYDEKYSMDVLDGVENFRSTKKGEGYGKKPMLSSVTGRYYNTAIKNNQKYYYKVRGYIKIDGERYYTEWSDETSKVAKRLTASVNKQVMKSSRSPEEGKLQVTLVKQASIKKYQIRYSDKDPAMESGYGQVYMKDNSKYKTTQSKTFSDKELIRSGEYVYVKARAVYTKADGSTGYGGWSNVMKVKIR